MSQQELWDAVIVGAGPAGLSAALTLSQAGWKVGMIEKAVLPREKVCGGFVGPENKDFLEQWGIWKKLICRGAQPITSFHMTGGDGHDIRLAVTSARQPAAGLGMMRADFDDTMAQAAREQGIQIWERTLFLSAESKGEAKEVRFRSVDSADSKTLRARHVIQATGAGQGKTVHAIGFGASFRGIRDMREVVHMHFAPGGHLGINPVKPGMANVCYVADQTLAVRLGRNPETMMKFFCEQNPLIRDQMKEAEQISAWKGVPISYRNEKIFYDGTSFYTGDTLAVVNPVVGGGISMGIFGGYLLGQLLALNRTEKETAAVYEKEWKKMLALRLRFSRLWGFLSHRPIWTRLILSGLQKQPAILNRIFELHHMPFFVPKQEKFSHLTGQGVLKT